jgi:polar amino acid transport system substrate-binding protein
LLAILALTGVLGAASAAADPIVLATGNDYKPFTDQAMPEGGMATAIVRAAFRREGREVEARYMPWQRGYHDTLDGLYAGTFPYVRTEERAGDYHYSAPLFTLVWRPLVMTDSDLSGERLSGLSGSRYCSPKGYALAAPLKALTEAGELFRVAPYNMSVCFKLLKNGRADFIPINNVQGPVTARESLGGMEQVRFLNIEITRKPLHVIFPKTGETAKADMAAFNAGLEKIEADGTFDRIVTRFLGGSDVSPAPCTSRSLL